MLGSREVERERKHMQLQTDGRERKNVLCVKRRLTPSPQPSCRHICWPWRRPRGPRAQRAGQELRPSSWGQSWRRTPTCVHSPPRLCPGRGPDGTKKNTQKNMYRWCWLTTTPDKVYNSENHVSSYLDVSTLNLEAVKASDGPGGISLVGELHNGKSSWLAVHVRQDLALGRAVCLKQDVQLFAGEGPRKVTHKHIMARFDDITIQTNVDSSAVQVGGVQVSNGFSGRSVIAKGNKAKAYTWTEMSLTFAKWQLTTKEYSHPQPLDLAVSSWRFTSADITRPIGAANSCSCSLVVDHVRFPTNTEQDIFYWRHEKIIKK